MAVVLERRCENCQRLLGPSRADRRFCSTACRVAAHRARRGAVEEEPEALSRELQDALARATREERLVVLVARAASTNWRAAAWLLERRFPERWGPRVTRVEREDVLRVDDPFAEVDELARKRRERRGR